MVPTVDSFHALARSSPWRWRTLHFTRRGGSGDVEAWVRRPGRLKVRDADGREIFESGVPYTRSAVLSVSADHSVPVPEIPDARPPQHVQPQWRSDGLVASRPSSSDVEYDDPMYGDFTWVAMLDPVELSHHVAVSDLRADELEGREVWQATLSADDGYDPRCPCCPLLWSTVSDTEEYGAPRADHTYPDGYDVALDAQTGVVVRCWAIGESSVDHRLEIQIHEVDADLDHLFPG